jgi:hypothetical protein
MLGRGHRIRVVCIADLPFCAVPRRFGDDDFQLAVC